MTFLEFVASELIGPPVSRSNGRAVWRCPFHNDRHPSFNTLPPHSDYKDRFRCWSCGAWGDEFDLLKHFYPGEDYGARQERIRGLRAKYEAQTDKDTDAFSFYRGSGGARTDDESEANNDFGEQANMAIADLLDYLGEPLGRTGRAALKTVAKALEICHERGVTMTAFASRCSHVHWVTTTEAKHRRKCADPNCEWAVCRGARGLPPVEPLPFEQRSKRRHRAATRSGNRQPDVGSPKRRKAKRVARRKR